MLSPFLPNMFTNNIQSSTIVLHLNKVLSPDVLTVIPYFFITVRVHPISDHSFHHHQNFFQNKIWSQFLNWYSNFILLKTVLVLENCFYLQILRLSFFSFGVHCYLFPYRCFCECFCNSSIIFLVTLDNPEVSYFSESPEVEPWIEFQEFPFLPKKSSTFNWSHFFPLKIAFITWYLT